MCRRVFWRNAGGLLPGFQGFACSPQNFREIGQKPDVVGLQPNGCMHGIDRSFELTRPQRRQFDHLTGLCMGRRGIDNPAEQGQRGLQLSLVVVRD